MLIRQRYRGRIRSLVSYSRQVSAVGTDKEREPRATDLYVVVYLQSVRTESFDLLDQLCDEPREPTVPALVPRALRHDPFPPLRPDFSDPSHLLPSRNLRTKRRLVTGRDDKVASSRLEEDARVVRARRQPPSRRFGFINQADSERARGGRQEERPRERQRAYAGSDDRYMDRARRQRVRSGRDS